MTRSTKLLLALLALAACSEDPNNDTGTVASGTETINAGSGLDFETGDTLIGTSGAADIVFELADRRIAVRNLARIGVYGEGRPTRTECENVNVGNIVIGVDSLTPADYFCASTPAGTVAWFHLPVAADPAVQRIQVEFESWAPN